MPHDWPLEAVKAQAVAARSYALAHRRGGALRRLQRHPRPGLRRDRRRDARGRRRRCGDEAPGAPLRREARGDVLLLELRRPHRRRHRRLRRLDADPVPRLGSRPVRHLAPYHTWGPVPVDGATASSILAVPGVTDLRPVPATGRARVFVLDGKNGEVTLPSGELRRALGLRSTWLSKVGVLSLSHLAGVLAAGSTVTLTGRAVQVDSPVLEQRPAGDDWQPGPALSIQPDGTFSVSVTPSVTTQYRLGAGTTKSAILRVSSRRREPARRRPGRAGAGAAGGRGRERLVRPQRPAVPQAVVPGLDPRLRLLARHPAGARARPRRRRRLRDRHAAPRVRGQHRRSSRASSAATSPTSRATAPSSPG